MSAQRGNRVKFSTFNSWGKGGVIGKKTEVDDNGTTYVNFVWCLLCTRNVIFCMSTLLHVGTYYRQLEMTYGLVRL